MSRDGNFVWSPIIPWVDDPALTYRDCCGELMGRPATEVEFVNVVNDEHSRNMRMLSGEFATHVKEFLGGEETSASTVDRASA